jgi:hypothetical protein
MTATLLRILPDQDVAPGAILEPEWLDPESGRVYADNGGLHLLRTVSEEDYLMTGSDQIGGPPKRMVQDGRLVHISELAAEANAYYYQRAANSMGRVVKCKVRDRYGNAVEMTAKPTRRMRGHGDSVTLTGADGRAIRMDLGVPDVHQPATLPTYVGGVRVADGIADVISPVIPVPHQSDYYATWNTSGDFNRKIANAGQAGGMIAEVNPGLAFAQYTTVTYQLAGFLPTEVMANADAPIRPHVKTMQVIVDALRVEREARVVTLSTASGSYQATLIQALLAGQQWNEGAASNPILILHNAIDAMYMPPTAIGMSGKAWRAFIRNPAVQKFIQYKAGVKGIPKPEGIPDEFDLPQIYVAEMKYIVNGALAFAWGGNVVLIHEPKEMPPTSQQDVAPFVTFRWSGGPVPPDGALTGGLLVRTFFDQKRGPRGGNLIICAHNDAEVNSSTYVGALITGATQ